MTRRQIYHALRRRNRRLAAVWLIGHAGHYGGLLGTLISVACGTGALIVQVSRYGPELFWTTAIERSACLAVAFPTLMTLSILLKYYALKRAGVDLALLGQETDEVGVRPRDDMGGDELA